MKSSKDINLDTYNLSLITAKEDVLNPRTSTNWALFAYDGVTNRLKLADSGVGGVSELVHKLHPRRPLYGLCRVYQPNTGQTHITMIIWVGKDVDDYRKAQCVAHVPAIKSFFKEVHFFLPASSLEDVTEDRIFSVASKVMEMMEKERTRRFLRHEDREETVGTNYKRTIAAAEIQKTHREKFWAQAEREEEERKEEERRRAAEERRRRERERVQQEKREAEERDRRMNEKLKKIQEQRRLKAQEEAEKHKQEQLKWAQQQQEFEEEMKCRFTHSESVEKAVEAATLVSQRKGNPREFFRQLSQSSLSNAQQTPPNSPHTVRSSNRKFYSSLTDTFIFTKSTSSSPSPPCSPKPLSPFLPSTPTSHSPTAFYSSPHTLPQHTHSPPTARSSSLPSSTTAQSPTMVSPSSPSGQTVVSSSLPCGQTVILPSVTTQSPVVVPPSTPIGQTVVSPSTTTQSQTVVPPFTKTQSTKHKVFSPSPPSGQTVVEIPDSSIFLQSSNQLNAQVTLSEIVENLTFYPPSLQTSANLKTQNLDQSENVISPHSLLDSSNSTTQSSICELDSPEIQVRTQVQPVPIAPSRPLPALPMREGSSQEVINYTGEDRQDGEKREREGEGEKEEEEKAKEWRDEETEEKEKVMECWVTAQVSMISIPEEEGDDRERREEQEEEKAREGTKREREGKEENKVSVQKDGKMTEAEVEEKVSEQKDKEMGEDKMRGQKDGKMTEAEVEDKMRGRMEKWKT
ncbi:drebrin [Hoplias malabaricus]|uniref:drebrin n=1 Tax=Hoplias malabaricus TaxID=27720 RepID=UPI00346197E8